MHANATATDHSLLTTREAAKRLAISPRKLWSLTDSGELRAVRIGSAVRYEPAALLEFVQRNSR